MTAAAPRVSVVMPVRNEERFVAAAIESTLEQTVGDIEVLVVDGGSHDRTAEIVRALATADSRISLLDNPAQTIPNALNVGLSHARGTYVARVDAHARINDTYLERALAELDTRPTLAAIGGRRIGVAETTTGHAVAAALSSPFGVGNSVNHYGTSKRDTDHASFGVYRAAVLAEVGGWDPALPVNEDVDIDHRILALGHAISYDPDMEIHWQTRETLREFGRQYRRYGRGKAAMVRKNGRSAIRLRHLAAPLLVLTFTAGAVMAVLGKPRALVAAVSAYALGVTGATVRTRRDLPMDERPAAARFGGALMTMHLAWGAGFLEGLLFRSPPAAASTVDPSPSTRP